MHSFCSAQLLPTYHLLLWLLRWVAQPLTPPLGPQKYTCPHACLQIRVIYVPKYDPSLGHAHSWELTRQRCTACTDIHTYSATTQVLNTGTFCPLHIWEGRDPMRPALVGDPLPGLGCMASSELHSPTGCSCPQITNAPKGGGGTTSTLRSSSWVLHSSPGLGLLGLASFLL